MAQHDYVLDNQGFGAMRSDLNLALAAIASGNSGNTAPSTVYPGLAWLDTSGTPWLVKQYNGTQWVTLYSINATTHQSDIVRGGTDSKLLATTALANISNLQAITYAAATAITAAATTDITNTTDNIDLAGSAVTVTAITAPAALIGRRIRVRVTGSNITVNNGGGITVPNGVSASFNAGDVFTLVITAANTVRIEGVVTANPNNQLINNFRLTPTSGTPVVTGDANAVGTLYMTPYNGNQIALYNGTRWNVRTSAEISISLASTSANNAYDVFCYDNAGTPTLELQVWSTATARSVALVYQDGVLVKSGAPTRRYLGSFYCHTNGQTASSLTNTGATTGRYIFNYYNRVLLRMQRFESTASWAYTGGYRQANGSTVNQLNFFIGVVEDAVACSQTGLANINSANSGALTAIGLNSTTSPLNGSVAFLNSQIINYATYASSTINATPTLGLNYLSWMEYGNAAGCTFFGSTYGQGINGAILC
jgi:hypothetical protein